MCPQVAKKAKIEPSPIGTSFELSHFLRQLQLKHTLQSHNPVEWLSQILRLPYNHVLMYSSAFSSRSLKSQHCKQIKLFFPSNVVIMFSRFFFPLFMRYFVADNLSATHLPLLPKDAALVWPSMFTYLILSK